MTIPRTDGQVNDPLKEVLLSRLYEARTKVLRGQSAALEPAPDDLMHYRQILNQLWEYENKGILPGDLRGDLREDARRRFVLRDSV